MTKEEVLALYDNHSCSVYRLALSYLGSVPDAEDIVQTVFLKLLENQPELLPGREHAWLMRVTVNACKDLLRSAWRRRWASFEDSLAETLISMNEEESELFRSVMALPAKYRIVVQLYYYEGYSCKEIAQLLNVSPSAVSMRLHRAKGRLKGISSEK